ncbi:MAG TPA: CHASE3 domain-containing protein, partial [Sphingomicrobium sp.]|nr:CHASE3 domain-containing protein [Sphingomicrobium sp.]
MMNFTDRHFNRIALSGLAIGFLLLVAAFVTSVAVLRGGRVSAEQVRHTYEVVDQLSLLEIQLERAETGRRGYLLSSSAYRVRLYDENIRLAPQSLENLKRLVGDNPLQLERTRKLETLMRDQLSDMRETMDLARSGEVDEARARFSAADRTSFIRAIRGMTAQMRQAEYELLALRSEGETANLRFMQSVLAVTGLLLFLVGAAAFWTVRRYTVDLTSTRDRLHVLITDLEGEVGRRTADLTRANEEIQRFAYIVSHDLRSPLVNILGFTSELETANKALGGLIERAENDAPGLLSDDIRHAQEDLPEAIGFIRASTQKMDRLINAILRLSREGRRTLTPEHLSMDSVI